MGRPAGSYNRSKLPQGDKPPSRQLALPKNTKRYEARKLQFLIRQIDKQAEVDPGAVNTKNYIEVLKRFSQLVEDLRKEQRAHGVDKKALEEETPEGDAANVRQGESAGVGSGVPAADPFAE